MKEAANVTVGAEAPAHGIGTETSPGGLREIFSSIQKALKIRKLYSSDGKPYQDAIAALGERLSSFLTEHDGLTILVTLDAFMVDDEAHLKSAKREGSIPFKLFRDGIRSVRIARGLGALELARFLEVLDFQPDAPGNLDEDMATIFWKQDFQSIEISVVDDLGAIGGGDFESGGGGSGIGFGSGGGSGGGGGKGDLGRGLEAMVDSLKGCRLFGCDGGGVVRFAQSTGEHLVTAEERDFFEMERLATASAQAEAGDDLFEVPESVVERLRSELDDDARGGLLTRVSDIVLGVLCEGGSTLQPAELKPLLFNLSQAVISKGDISGLNSLLSTLERWTRTDPQVAEELSRDSGDSPRSGTVPWSVTPRDALQGLLADLSSDASIQLLFAVASTGERSSPAQVEALLSRLPAAALRPSASQLGVLKPGLARDVCLRFLRARGHEDPNALVTYLEQVGGEEAVKDVRSILETKEIPGMASVLRKMLQHPEERARIDCLRVVTATAAGNRRALLELGIADPSSKVRLVALRAVEQSGDRGVVPALRARFEGAGKIDEDEQIRILHAIATLGGKEAVACLREILWPRKAWGLLQNPWSRSEKWRKSLAIHLRDVADPAVRELIGEGDASPRGSTRAVAPKKPPFKAAGANLEDA